MDLMEEKYCEDKKSEWNWEMKEKKITMKEGARIAFLKISESMSVFGLICLCMTSSGSRHLVKYFWCYNRGKDPH